MPGDTVNTAALMASIADRGRIIASRHTVDQLPAELRLKARRLDAAKLEGKAEAMVIYDIPWQSEGVTHLHADEADGLPAANVITITVGDNTFKLERGSESLNVGRDPSNDIVVDTQYASRFHARIEYQHNRFVIADNSTNGTYVVLHFKPMVYVRREQLPLRSTGRIGIGCPALSTDEYCLQFVTE